MDILIIVCLFFYLGRSWGQEQVYVISAPKVFYLGTSENVVIQAYGYMKSFSVIITIKSYPEKSFTYAFDQVDLSPENKFQNSANLTIQPKDLSGGPNAVSYVYLEVVSIHFSREIKIPLSYDNGFLFIQTDRSVYNLEQPVKVRVYSLDNDLKPSPREVTLIFIDPEGSEVATVEEKSCTGILTFPDFKLLSNPKYGLWTIEAKYKEDYTTTGTAYFEVKNSGDFSKETDVKYGLSPYTLDLVATPLSLKPGIPYFIKVQVKDTFDHFVGGISVTLKAKTVDKNQEKRDLDPRNRTTNYQDGIASFMVNIPTDVTALEFHVRTDDPDLPEQCQARRYYQAVTYSSPSQNFLSLSWTSSYRSLLVGEHLSITVTPESPYVDKIKHYSYLISSKGKIVHFGTEKRIPGSSSQILNLSVTQQMVPTAHLLVYYIITGELTELVSDSLCLNIEEKCGNQLRIHLSPSKDAHFPDEAISLIMETQSESWVALTALDSATYGSQERGKSLLERVFGASGKIDRGCGVSGGGNNAEVFDAAELTVLTNAGADKSQQIADGSHKNINRSRRSLKEEIDNLASQFRHPVVQKCCYDGARESEKTCTERAAQITVGPRCVAAFSRCCRRASELRGYDTHKLILLSPGIGTEYPSRFVSNSQRSSCLSLQSADITELPKIPTLSVQVPRRTVSENWLWEVHHVPKRHQMELTVPDFQTTWEIQGVGISDKGLCVADVLMLQVYEDQFPVINNSAIGLN